MGIVKYKLISEIYEYGYKQYKHIQKAINIQITILSRDTHAYSTLKLKSTKVQMQKFTIVRPAPESRDRVLADLHSYLQYLNVQGSLGSNPISKTIMNMAQL